MREALKLARRAWGRTSPNPLVGAVVVKEGVVLGRGYHRRAGDRHAEVVALDRAGEAARGAEVFINLEPCSHTGRTPPCVGSLIHTGVGRVWVGMIDPNPLVSGRGIEALRRGGIDVRVGLLEEECQKLNRAFVKYIASGVPFVTLKIASTLDGKIATGSGDSRWITGEKSRLIVHRLRNRVDAIMVGINTVLRDDPELTCRIPGGRNPARVIMDSRLRIPPGSKVLQGDKGSRVIVVTRKGNDPGAKALLRSQGVDVVEVPAPLGRPDLLTSLRELARREIVHLMIEGGGELAASALSAGMVDQLLFFYAPAIVGSEGKSMVGSLGVDRMGEALRLRQSRWKKVADDMLLEGYF
jgi:diaminohydroxyphosphoribosylaminopyrimidine deaminase/5-amino-6-(5-phosphoribosylamino)uracil reductase